MDDNFKVLLEEVRDVRKEVRGVRDRIDTHITDNTKEHTGIKEDVADMRSDITANRGKISTMAAGVAMFVSVIGTWLMTKITGQS